MIPVPLDVVHAVEDDEAIAAEQTFGARVGDASGFLFGARIVVDGARVGGIVRRNDVDLVAGFAGGNGAGVEEGGLRALQLGGELVGAVGQSRAGIACQDDELEGLVGVLSRDG